MTSETDLLRQFLQAMARHSGLRGDPLSEVFAAAARCLAAGTGTPAIAFETAVLTGENLLVAHEIDLRAALEEAGIPISDTAADPDADTAWVGLDPAEPVVIDEDGTIRLVLHAASGPLGALRLATPPDGWHDEHEVATLGGAVADELRRTVLRHWSERQHLDRTGALLEAQRHTHVGCFEWDIVADKVRWSDELFRIFGDEPQSFEPTFEEFLERIHEDDRESVRASVFTAYEQRRDYRIEERIVRADGAVRQLSSWGHVIVDETTVPVKIVGSCQDVTDFRSVMHDLALTERRLAEVEERRNRALELNDNVVQGLVSAIFAMELGLTDKAITALNGTLGSARSIIGDMLMANGEDMEKIGLLRSEAAHSFLAPAPAAAPTEDPAGAPTRVLVADDSSDVRLLTSMILRNERDFQVVGEAANGVEAIDRVRDLRPEIVLLDLAMPVLDGLSAITAIRTESPSTTIVVFSGFNAGAAADEAIARGAHAYVEKGLTNQSLPEVLRRIRDRAPADPPFIARSA